MQQKNDAHLFKQVIDSLKNESWLGNRKWWPNYLFHFTDIKNAAKILSYGKLLSRDRITLIGDMENENASPEVINNTVSKWKKYVRFYFRPRTPTQFNNEGFRPINERLLGGAHCPMPIFFIFHSLPLIALEDSQFSYGSLASHGTETYNTIEKFKEMPFASIYHEGSYDPHSQNYIKYHRHAELIIPDDCDLEYLYGIVCRSHAEKETFLHHLDAPTAKIWEKLISVDTSGKLFYSHWTYIDRAVLSTERIIFYLNKGNRVKGVFEYHLDILEHQSGKHYYSSKEGYSPKDILSFDLKNLKNSNDYTVTLRLDGDLAYSNVYKSKEDDDLPF
ncbi:DarT ssDNA thymidine ADP-ribosyltransferase family protein [Paenibacillus sp. FSL R10-2782]|uniref:DarT ssDNA thymidine ADP-ribosyltransferase family protein n=1 Tax=Paenibacillus sp. FSL R10-2782 TaxID=2954661 RepID=UPI0031581C1E